jgi:hypothetical protein
MASPQHNSRFAEARSTQSQSLLTRLFPIGLGLLSLGLLTALLWTLINQYKPRKLTLVAGDKTGESYILGQAIKQVVEANSNIKIEVKETGGTSSNLRLLEGKECDGTEKLEGKCNADLATAQADVPSGPSARTVAVLYQDLFQVVVKDPKIQQFTDLRNRRIALQGKGGQFTSFKEVAAHYGMTIKDFQIKGLTLQGEPIPTYNDKQGEQEFQDGRADAMFRVRAAGHKPIAEAVQKYGARLVPIDQAAAMKIKYPAFEPATLPKGAYKGNPTIPAADLPTVGVNRLLLAHKRVNNDTIRDFTRILDENRQAIAEAIPEDHEDVKPLVASITRPTISGNNAPLHPGALAHYERDEPSFIQEYADFVGLLLTVGLLLGSWIWEIKRWVERRKKNVADEYIQTAINLIDNPSDPTELLNQLDDVFEKAAKGLIDENISQESFRTFNEAYKTVREVLERREKGIRKGRIQPPPPPLQTTATVSNQ